MVESAAQLARDAHEGQTDKSGNAYATHPARVAARVAAFGPSAQAVAWLHDVAEDTSIDVADLAQRGFPNDVVEAVDAITKRPGEDLETYCQRVAANPLALAVKRADVADNSDPARLALLDEVTRTRLEGKYATVRRLLDRASV